MRDLDQEVFKLILLDGQNHILRMCDVGKGSLTTAKVYPREVVKAALRHSAAAVVVVHNHPSGLAKPSRDDEAVTRDLVFACVLLGMKLHDHIIIGDNETFSFADAGLIARYAKQAESR
jgi:DNA repair protein RadC